MGGQNQQAAVASYSDFRPRKTKGTGTSMVGWLIGRRLITGQRQPAVLDARQEAQPWACLALPSPFELWKGLYWHACPRIRGRRSCCRHHPALGPVPQPEGSHSRRGKRQSSRPRARDLGAKWQPFPDMRIDRCVSSDPVEKRL